MEKGVFLAPIEAPAVAKLLEKLEGLVDGSVTREAASRWAWRWIGADDPGRMDPVIWSALNYLGGADSPSTDRPYLYGLEDFQSWLADVRAGRVP
jgi:hypothetical protein